MNSESTATTPYIRPHPRRAGVQAVDPIEEAQFALLTADPVTPEPCESDLFYSPVDTAAAVRTSAIETPYFVDVWVRDGDGELVADGVDGELSVSDGRYNVELSTTGMKLYLAVDGAMTVRAGEGGVRFVPEGTGHIAVGVRSLHEQPAATVTTTREPRDVMRAVSTLGSALKTTSCERSFPTLRGHPPLIELDDEVHVPEGVEPPDTGVRIEVPPELDRIFPVAPLAYYLGATVEPGSDPCIVADGSAIPLDGEGGFERTVERTLKQVFLLDCVTRTEGYYQVDLHERRVVEDAVDPAQALDFASLYDRPLAERVRRYLSLPFAAVSDAVPTWKQTADVVPTPDRVSTLPFLANELAVVRCPTRADVEARRVDGLADRIEEFFKRNPAVLARSTDVRADAETATADDLIFRPAESDSNEQAYVGDGIPLGASKMTVDAYYRRLDHEPVGEPRIRVDVVCNDLQMASENVVSSIYGERDWIDFDIGFHAQLSTAELRDLLHEDIDLLHYIGHVDDQGMRCTDGYLDTNDLEDVGVQSFVLNACNSYEQGRALVESGAFAGIVTVTEVLDEGATEVGRTVAKLLNQGFSLGAAISLIKEHENIGHHYVGVGDGSLSLVKNESGTPLHAEVRSDGDEGSKLALYADPSLTAPIGGLFRPHIDGVRTRYINAGEVGQYEFESAEATQLLSSQDLPVIVDGEVRWSTELRDEN